jgi:hypothetical protein
MAPDREERRPPARKAAHQDAGNVKATLPSTFGLSPDHLRAERRRRVAEGWGEWEIKARFADPDADYAQLECPGEFGPGRQFRARCQECAA